VFQFATNLQVDFYHKKFFITLILMGKPNNHITPKHIESPKDHHVVFDLEEKKICGSPAIKKQRLVFVNLREPLKSTDKQR